MTFSVYSATRFRLSRSVIYAMGHQPACIEAAANSEADVVLFELEDAVPVDKKNEARSNVLQALGDLDWSKKAISVRVNALDSPFTYQDVISLLESPVSSKIDLLFLPKPGNAADVYAFDVMVTQVERAMGRDRPVGFDIMIESTLGLTNAAEIAQASARIESLQFGSYDYGRSACMQIETVGGPHSGYQVGIDGQSGHLNDPFHYPLSRIIEVARAFGKRPIDGPYIADLNDYDADPTGFEASARRGRILGSDGKQALTPAQAAIANRIHTPTADEIERSEEICSAAQAADGSGVRSLNGKYLDEATIQTARNTVAKAEEIQRRS